MLGEQSFHMALRHQDECRAWRAMFPNMEFDIMSETIAIKVLTPQRIDPKEVHPGDKVSGDGYWSNKHFVGWVHRVEKDTVAIKGTREYGDTVIYLNPESVKLIRRKIHPN